MPGIKWIVDLLRRAFDEFNEDEAPRLGAAVAFYSALSMGPLLLLVIAIAGLVFGTEAATGAISSQIHGLVGPQGAQAIEDIIAHSRNEEQGFWAAGFGIIMLIVSATGFFAELQAAFNTIFDVPKTKVGLFDFIGQRVLSFGMIMAIAVLLLVSLTLSAGLSAMADLFGGNLSVVMLQIFNFVLSFFVTTLLFAMTFKFMPDVKLRWADVWIGAAITSLLFTLGKSLIGIYLGNAAVGSTYGAAGSLIVLLIWIYYSIQIIFFGAEVTQVYATRSSDLSTAQPVAETLPARPMAPASKSDIVVALASSVILAGLGWMTHRRERRRRSI